MKTIKDFTPEIQAKIPDYIKKGLNGVFDGKYYENFDIEKAKKAVYWNYEKCGFKKPLVLAAENPYEIFVIYKMLLMMNEKDEKKIKEQLKNISSSNLYLFTLNVYSNYYYYWYKFIKEEFKLSLSIEKDFEECFQLQRESGVYSALFLDGLCIVSKYPKRVYRDTNNNLHNTTGIAVEWGYSSEESKFECYYIHGRNISSKDFNLALNNKVTKTIWLKEKNEDVKAAWFEILGAEKLINLLGAKEIDTCMQSHLDGTIEDLRLYKTSEILPEIGEPLAWVKFICPSTNTNYFISVNPKHDKVMDAVLETCPFYGKEIKSLNDYKFTQRG